MSETLYVAYTSYSGDFRVDELQAERKAKTITVPRDTSTGFMTRLDAVGDDGYGTCGFENSRAYAWSKSDAIKGFIDIQNHRREIAANKVRAATDLIARALEATP